VLDGERANWMQLMISTQVIAFRMAKFVNSASQSPVSPYGDVAAACC